MTEATPEAMQRVKELSKEAIEKFTSPNLLILLKNEFDKDHIGDDRSKLFLFLCELSGLLPKQYRFSCALFGDSSEGKTNMAKTTLKHLPPDWYLDIGRITSSCIEDDLGSHNIIAFQEVNEKGLNSQIIETIKAIVEDGLHVMKKDKKNDNKTVIDKNIERKVGIYTTTGSIYDDELATRYCLVPVTGRPDKYSKVNKRTKETASDPHKEIEARERGRNSWIMEGLKQLKPVDVITIPDADMIKTQEVQGRSMRDVKRYLNLIRVIVWVHQRNRRMEKIGDYTVLYAEPEDIYNAYQIGADIFNQSYTQLDNRSKETLEALIELVEKKGIENPELLEAEEEYKRILWVERVELQRKLKLTSSNTIKKRLQPLKNLGFVTTKENKGNKAFVSLNPSDEVSLSANPSIHPSTTHQTPVNSPSLKNNFLCQDPTELYETLMGKRRVNDGLVTGKMTGKRTCLLSIKDELPISQNNNNADKTPNDRQTPLTFSETTDGQRENDILDGAEIQ